MTDDPRCPECGRRFATETRRDRHVATSHGGGLPIPSGLGPKIAVALALVAAAVVGAALMGGDEAPTGSLMQTFGAEDDPFLGNESAPVTVVTFETPRCPSCKRYHTQMFPEVRADYVETGQVRYHYAQFDIGYAFDKPGGIAQECVARHAGNEAFFNFTDRLYERQGEVNADNVDDLMRTFAEDEGHEADPMVSCYHDRDTEPQYQQDVDTGRAQGVRGTPYFFVWGPEEEATATGATGLRDAIEDKLPGGGGA